MRKIIAFYDLLIYAIICGPLIVITVFLLSKLLLNRWIIGDVFIFAPSFVLSFVGTKMFRYYKIANDTIYFHYFPFTTSWEKAANNIDVKWNQNVFISEIKDIEIIKLTDDEKQTKVFYKHWFNKYLKINLKHSNPKYVYVGNYSNYQIQKIIKTINTTKKTQTYSTNQ